MWWAIIAFFIFVVVMGTLGDRETERVATEVSAFVRGSETAPRTFPSIVEYRITLSKPLEERELRAYSVKFRSEKNLRKNVWLLFVLQGWPHGRRIDDEKPVYAIHHFDENEERFFPPKTTPSKVKKYLAERKGIPGSVAEGVWVDFYRSTGAAILVLGRASDGHYLVDQFGHRWKMRYEGQRENGRWLVAETSEVDGKVYAADGEGSNRVAVLVTQGGNLHFFESDAAGEPLPNLPFAIGIPWPIQ